MTPQRGADRAQKGFACPHPWPRPSNPGGAGCKDSGNRVSRGWPAALPGPRVCGLEASPSPSQRRQLRAPRLTWGQTPGGRAEGRDGNHLRAVPFPRALLAAGRSGGPLTRGPWPAGGRDPGLMGQGNLRGDLVWGLASLPLGSPPSRCERRRGAMGTRGASPAPLAPPWGLGLRSTRGLGATLGPDLEEEAGRWGEGSAGAGGASRRVYLHSRHRGYLGARALSWPQCQRFSQPGAHRAPIPGSRQLGESGCGTPPAAGQQKTAPCVGTHGPVPLGTHSPIPLVTRSPVPLGIRRLPALPHPDESFPQ